MAQTARVRPDVTGCLYDSTRRRFVTLDGERTWDPDDPIVVANPDVFHVVETRKKTRAKGGN